jgi:hypothetical protein
MTLRDRTHTFRWSLATHLYDAGCPLRQIMAITGHARWASLTSYLNLEQQAAGDALLGFFLGGSDDILGCCLNGRRFKDLGS